jgi:uncharacterized protein
MWAISNLPGTTGRLDRTWSSTASLFEEAQTVFLDENARLIDDPDHSAEEERFVLLGFSFQARCLIVSHCYREAGSVIRLISALRASVQEEQIYWRFR